MEKKAALKYKETAERLRMEKEEFLSETLKRGKYL